MDELKTIKLINLTEAPIHILAKNEEGGIENVVIAPTDVVAVSGATLSIGGGKTVSG